MICKVLPICGVALSHIQPGRRKPPEHVFKARHSNKIERRAFLFKTTDARTKNEQGRGLRMQEICC